MKELSELDKAVLKVEFKKMYREIGYNGCIQVLYEFLVSASILADVLKENSWK